MKKVRVSLMLGLVIIFVALFAGCSTGRIKYGPKTGFMSHEELKEAYKEWICTHTPWYKVVDGERVTRTHGFCIDELTVDEEKQLDAAAKVGYAEYLNKVNELCLSGHHGCSPSPYKFEVGDGGLDLGSKDVFLSVESQVREE